MNAETDSADDLAEADGPLKPVTQIRVLPGRFTRPEDHMESFV
jgi:hypothetical protein